jgi:hypothetical protein
LPTTKDILSVVGPFPVAGLAYWVDDWHAYRCCPKPHLHQGLDLMAPRGTPLVSVADGVISEKVYSPDWSGIALAVTDRSGIKYFYAHLNNYASGIHVGQQVERGQVIGFVGNTGDAAGGPTHLHFEIRINGVATPPKPEVDRWLDVSQRRAVRLVRKVTGKRITDADLDLDFWKNRLLELAKTEIQASNLAAVKRAAPAAAPRAPDQQTLPYTLPVVLLALLAGSALLADRRGSLRLPLRRRRLARGDPSKEATETDEEADAIVLEGPGIGELPEGLVTL